MNYTNSPLVSYTQLSPNNSGLRTNAIDRITPHCVVGQLSAKAIAGLFKSPSKEASCNYAIGTEGDVALVVEEKNRSWCSSSNANDQRAVTIECASDKTHPYTMNNKVYARLVDLCTDICQRNGKKKLLWFADKAKSLNYNPKADEMVITVHRWFKNKACPGDWLYNRLGDLAAEVTARLNQSPADVPEAPSASPKSSVEEVAKKVIAGDYGNGEERKKKLEAEGYSYSEVQNKVNELLGAKTQAKPEPKPQPTPQPKPALLPLDEIAQQVIKGLWSTGNVRKAKLEAAGYNYNEVQKRVNELLSSKKATPKKDSLEKVARDIIAGHYGNGNERIRKLEAAGYNYKEVQALVNKMLK